MADPHPTNVIGTDIDSAVAHFSSLARLRQSHQDRITSPPPDSRLFRLRSQPQLWPSKPAPPSPDDARSLRFHNMLLSLAAMPTRWENPTLLDDALRLVPLQRIYDEAEEESQLFSIEAASLASTAPMSAPVSDFVPKWAFQDCVIRALLRWFRNDFFTWVNNPACSRCGSPTVGVGMAAPSSHEIAHGAVQVELYRCSDPGAVCGSFERFPRYSDPSVLLKTRKGRVGEWANCFGMLCRAMGARVRWVWNSEDHVWIEVYSNHRNRWVHVDACEEAWDRPKLYTEGWGRKLAYCIAFSADGGASDVTRRYVRDPLTQALPRTRVSEPVLAHTIEHIRSLRRANLTPAQHRRIEAEDRAEEAELSGFFFLALMPAVLAYLRTVKVPASLAGPDRLMRLQAHALSTAQRDAVLDYRAQTRKSWSSAFLSSSRMLSAPPPVRPGSPMMVDDDEVGHSRPQQKQQHQQYQQSHPGRHAFAPAVGTVQTAPNSVTSTIVTPSSDLVDVTSERAGAGAKKQRRGGHPDPASAAGVVDDGGAEMEDASHAQQGRFGRTSRTRGPFG